MLASILTFLGINQTYAKIIEAVVFVAIIAGATIYVMSLRETAHKYKDLVATVHSLEQKYECSKPLTVCLADRDMLAAREHIRLQTIATQERARADKLNAQLQDQYAATEKAIDDSTAVDGALPPIVQEQWDRERAERGVK